jgi:hypothetical protein
MTQSCGLGLLQSAIEEHFAVHVTRERRMRDVHVLTNTKAGGQMLRQYPDPQTVTAWFEEILGGQVIDETGLPGIYGFELKERVSTPEEFIQLLRDDGD